MLYRKNAEKIKNQKISLRGLFWKIIKISISVFSPQMLINMLKRALFFCEKISKISPLGDYSGTYKISENFQILIFVFGKEKSEKCWNLISQWFFAKNQIWKKNPLGEFSGTKKFSKTSMFIFWHILKVKNMLRCTLPKGFLQKKSNLKNFALRGIFWDLEKFWKKFQNLILVFGIKRSKICWNVLFQTCSMIIIAEYVKTESQDVKNSNGKNWKLLKVKCQKPKKLTKSKKSIQFLYDKIRILANEFSTSKIWIFTQWTIWKNSSKMNDAKSQVRPD